ncbi:MAG: hypothetical protein Q4A01_12005 [Coriobacteriales bacterium]|nr:hypothetical protein [Coriobacteriales bacterium]
MAKNVRLNKKDQEAASRHLAGKTVKFADGTLGEVVRVTRASIVVRSAADGVQRPYALARSFLRGDLTFVDKYDQGYFVSLLRKLGVDSFDDDDNHGGVSRDTSVNAPVVRTPQVEQLDVAGNIRLVCFFKNVGEEAFIKHMSDVGFEGFNESLEKGLEKNPYVALREAEYYLGCSLEQLLVTYEEFLQRVFKECSGAKEWAWTEPKSMHAENGVFIRGVKCMNVDGKRFFFVHAAYLDDDWRQRDAMQANFGGISRNLSEMHALRYNVLQPCTDTMAAFDAAFEEANGAGDKTPTTNDGPLRNVTPGREPTLSKRAQRKTARYGNVPRDASKSSAHTSGKTTEKQAKPIHVNEFLVRRSYGSHRTNGHSLEPIRATVSILPRSGGSPIPVEFDAYWCPKCRKYFMGEGTYTRLKRRGYICCKIVEEKDLGTKRVGDGLYGNLASESILHMYGYTVNQQDNLSEVERRTIISFVIENRIQSAQDIAHLLEWLISQREGNPRMSVAVSRWRSDLTFVKRYKKPTRTVRVDRIYAKI